MPFSTSWSYSDIHSAISPDILHQIFKGVFKHVMAWNLGHISLNHKMTIPAAQKELDQRFQQMFPWPGLKSFNKGISEIKTWQGHEQKDMMRVYLGAVTGLVDDEVLRAVRYLVQFIMVAEYKCHSDATLDYMDKCLRGFYERKHLLVPEKELWKIPKLHAITHYVSEIKAKGATDGYTSNHTERAHKLECKTPYKQTNKRDYEGQIIKHVDRRGKLIHKARYLENLAIQGGGVEVPGQQHIGSRLGTAAVVGSTLPDAQKRLHCAFPSLNQKISSHFHILEHHRAHPQDACPPFDGIIKQYTSLHCVYYPTHDESGNSGVLSDLVSCIPGKHPFVLVLTDQGAIDLHGMDGKRVAKIRLLFTVKRDTETIPLALVDWFSVCGSTPEPLNGMYKIKHKLLSNGRQDSGIISITAIVRGVHLIPQFIIPTVKRDLGDVIDETHYFFINNYIDDHMYHSMY
jgi:hypothetical protein